MAKYHINPASGSVGTCRATKGECPFGDESQHYENPTAARRAFEERMSTRPLDRSTLKSLTADELRATLLREVTEIGGDAKLVADAALFAKELHRGEFRRAAAWEERPPYIVHPLRNTIRSLRWGSKSTAQLIACLLHDTLEDTAEKYCDARGIPYDSPQEAREILRKKISKTFGKRAAEIVVKLSNPLLTAEEKTTRTPQEKIDNYVNHLRESIRDDEETLVSKLSDLYDNGAGLYHTAFPGNEEQTRKQAIKYLAAMPAFREELARNPIKDPVLRHSVFNALVLTEDRLKALIKD